MREIESRKPRRHGDTEKLHQQDFSPCLRVSVFMPAVCSAAPAMKREYGRRSLFRRFISFVMAASLASAALAADPGELPAGLDSAVSRGFDFLEKQQGPDGAFEATGPRLATTGLGLMAYLAAGHVPDVGRYGIVVRNAVDFLLHDVPEDGYFGRQDNSRMYGHGIVTLALAEAYGVEPDPVRRKRMHAVLTRAVKVILDAQAVQKPERFAGGWRYEPNAADSDVSLSGWNALALRAAANVGLDVPKEAVEKAVAFIMHCWNAETKGFSYQPGGAATPGPTAVAVLSLHLLEAGDREEVALAAQSLAAQPVDQRFPYYSQYYATQAANQLDDAAWTAIGRPIIERLIASQQEDGGWPASPVNQEPGRVYATSMSLLTLTVPYKLLPVYQK